MSIPTFCALVFIAIVSPLHLAPAEPFIESWVFDGHIVITSEDERLPQANTIYHLYAYNKVKGWQVYTSDLHLVQTPNHRAPKKVLQIYAWVSRTLKAQGGVERLVARRL